MRATLAAGLAVGLLTPAACGVATPATPEPAEAPPGQSQVEERPADGGPAAEAPVDVSLRHPNGTLVRLTRVTTAGNQVGLDFEATNGFTSEIELNSNGVWLLDDQGNEYNFTESPDNSTLRVGSGATLAGTLVFLGPIDAQANALQLRFNVYPDEDFDIAEGYDESTRPGFIFRDLPVPGR